MHSHDRTMLSRLGFADPDKRNGLHDSVISLLVTASDEVKKEVIGRLIPNFAAKILGTVYASSEVPLAKGEGQYKTVIGFLDLVFGFDVEGHGRRELIVEVKVGWPGVGDVVRQLNLYREFYNRGNTSFAVLSTSIVDTLDIENLKRQRIHFFSINPTYLLLKKLIPRIETLVPGRSEEFFLAHLNQYRDRYTPKYESIWRAPIEHIFTVDGLEDDEVLNFAQKALSNA
jgi:hypothetical protein